MAIDHKARVQTIVVGPETDLAEILDLAKDEAVMLERGGIRYVVEREPANPRTPIDASAYREALRGLQAAFVASGIDAGELKREIRQGRGHDDVAE